MLLIGRIALALTKKTGILTNGHVWWLSGWLFTPALPKEIFP